MQVVCCVCHVSLGERPGPADAVSHGLCLEHFRSELRAGGISEEQIEEMVARLEVAA